ncbi:16561_t:CDS:2 [Cetraspora pellucida]|uniref:16561_t:CDS:1 n=1 Tax=Cetraspora pellucida TaxID=1433469 RepID=A0A9N9CEV5_9GLOM|nr:16561_t:CDS:2 [Cetraspora pellucida]
MSVLIKSANIVGFLALVAIAIFVVLQNLNYFSISNSQNTESGNATNTTETYLTPPVYTFGVWFLIFPLLLGFIIYQWFDGDDGAVVNALVILSIVGLFMVDFWCHDNIFAFTIIWILIGVAINNVENLPVYTVSLAGIGLISGGIFRNWFKFSREWYSAFNFVETGGGNEHDTRYRSYRTDEPFGPSGHYMTELYSNP